MDSLSNEIILDKRKERTLKKLKGYLNSIQDPNTDKMMQARIAFYQKYMARIEHLDGLRDSGLKGKDYSDAVVKYDKEVA